MAKFIFVFEKCDFLRFFKVFKISFIRIGLDWRALVKLRSPIIEKQRFFFYFYLIFFKFRIFEIFFNFLGFFLWFFVLIFFFVFLLIYFNLFIYIYFFFWFLWILFKVTIRLLLKVTEVTTGHQKWPKRGQNSIIRFFCPKGNESLGPLTGRIF